MGWSTQRTYKRKNTEEIKAFFKAEFPTVEILYLSIQNFREVYIAMKDTKGKVFAAICLIENRCDEFGYKAMSEEEMPYYYNAPAKLLKMLSPTDNTNALEWREANNRRKIIKKGMKFNHHKLGVMIVHKVGTQKVIAMSETTGFLWRVLKETVLNNLICPTGQTIEGSN